jgi:hypothetical protein
MNYSFAARFSLTEIRKQHVKQYSTFLKNEAFYYVETNQLNALKLYTSLFFFYIKQI